VSRKKMNKDYNIQEWGSDYDISTPTGEFSLQTAEEVRNAPVPKIRWAVPDILPEGLAILGGDPKIGKSFMALQLCGAIGGFGDFFGTLNLTYGKSVYLALEDPQWRLTTRIKGMFGDDPLPGFYIRTSMGPWGSPDWLDLGNWVENNPECRVVVVDTFVRIRPPDHRGLDAYQASNALGKEMLTWAHTHHVALLLVHHKSKTNESSDPVKSLSGSIGFAGSADTIMLLSRSRTEREAKLFITGRDVGEREIDLVHEPDTGRWLMSGATTKHRHHEPGPSGPIGIVPAEGQFVSEQCFSCGNPVKEKTAFGAVCRRCHPA
jgi:hypothetical protein